jgi:hypothetical protein
MGWGAGEVEVPGVLAWDEVVERRFWGARESGISSERHDSPKGREKVPKGQEEGP